jgi:hypothetical protein
MLPRCARAEHAFDFPEFGAGKEARTPDLNLGKVALYQLSYSRDIWNRIIFTLAPTVKKYPCFACVY